MSGYDRTLVEHLLPAVWDETYAYGMRAPYTPDPDMPRGKPDPKTGGTIYAHLADIRRAWDRAPVIYVDRCAVLLRFGFDLTHRESGALMGVSHVTAGQRVERGVGVLTAWLNGLPYDDGDPDNHPID